MTSTRRPRSLRATHRLAALLVGLFWCAAPILAAVHANAEVHRYCAEHGMVEEGREAGVAGGTSVTPSADTAPSAGDASQDPPHDGCAFARVCRFGQVLASLALAAAGELDPAPIAPLPVAQPAAPVAVLYVAPKTSPPV
jgi:hypothetical protein